MRRTVSAFLIVFSASAAFAVDAMPPDPLTDDTAPATPADKQERIRVLIKRGEEASVRFNANKRAHPDDIIDAAMAFKRVNQLLKGSDDEATLLTVQNQLYWCRKQMDVDTLERYNHRLAVMEGREPADASAPRVSVKIDEPPLAAAAKPDAPPAVPREPAKPEPIAAAEPPRPSAATQASLAEEFRKRFTARTRERAITEVKAKKAPRFQLSSMRQEAIIEACDAKMLTLRLGDTKLDLPWKSLSDDDYAGLAVDLTRSHDIHDHALAAYWLRRTGHQNDASVQMMRAGVAGAEVDAALGAQAH